MGIIKSLSKNPDMVEVFRKFNDGLMPLCEYHDVILRGDSPLSVAERELIAAYVSGLNACNFCFDAHQSIAAAHGVDPELLEAILLSPEFSDVDKKLLPILEYVRKLTLTPGKMTGADAEAVYAAGWSEKALFHTVAVCALFNFMNRMVDGLGITPSAEMEESRNARLEAKTDDRSYYRDFGRMVLDQSE
jgi:uncharacterized peroxidase-related enzyme